MKQRPLLGERPVGQSGGDDAAQDEESSDKASKNRKALELLRDRQRQAWELEQRRMEAARLDEQTTQAYAAKVMSDSKRCVPSSPRSSSSSSLTS